MTDRKYISTTFSNYENVNDEFVKCTVSVNSYDQIANGTKFRKEAIDKALPTLNYAPVIGYFKDNDFLDHGIEYVINNNGIEEVIKTIPFGVVIKDSYRWTKLQKENGEMEEYVLVDCYLWSRYKDAIDKVKENKCNQSMEVVINSGEYCEDGYYDISDFSYSALCILGEEVAPAFNLAKIRTSDKFSKDDFKVVYSEMSMALDKFLNFEEGGDFVEEKFKKKIKCKKCESEIEVDEDFEGKEDYICEECNKTEKETFKKKTITFELSFDEIREKLYSLIKEEDCYTWIVETFNDKFVYIKEAWSNDTYTTNYYRQSYKLENDIVSLSGEPVEVFAEFLTKEEQDILKTESENYTSEIEKLKIQCSDLQTELKEERESFNNLSNEVIELREFKVNIEKKEYQDKVNEMLDEYSELEAIDGYSEIIKDKYSMKIDELEAMIKIFAFDNGVVLKNRKNKKNFNKKDTSIVFEKNEKTENLGVWSLIK